MSSFKCNASSYSLIITLQFTSYSLLKHSIYFSFEKCKPNKQFDNPTFFPHPPLSMHCAASSFFLMSRVSHPHTYTMGPTLSLPKPNYPCSIIYSRAKVGFTRVSSLYCMMILTFNIYFVHRPFYFKYICEKSKSLLLLYSYPTFPSKKKYSYPTFNSTIG